jgi:uncharacterized membrane protein YbhN (UPF0104 family)
MFIYYKIIKKINFIPFKMETDLIIAIICGIVIFAAVGVLIYLGKKNGLVQFLEPAHFWSLLLLVIAGVLTWAAMVWIVNLDLSPKTINSKQYVSLVTSLLISVLWWGRYVYTVSDVVKEAED